MVCTAVRYLNLSTNLLNSVLAIAAELGKRKSFNMGGSGWTYLKESSISEQIVDRCK